MFLPSFFLNIRLSLPYLIFFLFSFFSHHIHIVFFGSFICVLTVLQILCYVNVKTLTSCRCCKVTTRSRLRINLTRLLNPRKKYFDTSSWCRMLSPGAPAPAPALDLVLLFRSHRFSKSFRSPTSRRPVHSQLDFSALNRRRFCFSARQRHADSTSLVVMSCWDVSCHLGYLSA